MVTSENFYSDSDPTRYLSFYFLSGLQESLGELTTIIRDGKKYRGVGVNCLIVIFAFSSIMVLAKLPYAKSFMHACTVMKLVGGPGGPP
jgi:hypothetical protein